MRNGGVAWRYAAAALAVAASAWWLGKLAWLLLWPAGSLAAQATAYAGRSAMVYRKANGLLPLSVRILLAPYLLSARVILHYYGRGRAAWAMASPTLWIGRRLTDAEASEAVRQGVTAALDLTAGFPECGPLRSLTYCNIQLLPLTIPTLEQLHDAVRFLHAQSQRGIVYVHDALGHSRCAGVVAAYLMFAGLEAHAEPAAKRVCALIPHTLLDDRWMLRLREFEAGLPAPGRRF